METHDIIPIIRFAITLLAVLHEAQLVCSVDADPQQRLLSENDHLLGESRPVMRKSTEETLDEYSFSGPTDNPLDFKRAENIKLNLTFGEAVVLAKEEAKCLAQFVSNSSKNTVFLVFSGFFSIHS